MTILIYALKRGFEVQKAERYFKERGIPIQAVDLKKRPIGLRELRAVAAKTGVRALIDEASPLYRESTLPYLRGDEAILEALSKRPALLVTPIVRNGALATVGYRPEVWDGWRA